jgi:hypothetical protein
MEREPALVAMLPRQPGTKESRYAHLLSGRVEAMAAVAETASVRRDEGEDAGHEQRIAQLEATVTGLRQEITALRQRIDDLFGD